MNERGSDSFAHDGSAVERQVRRMKSFSRLKKVALSAAPLAAKHSSALFDAAESLEGDAHFSFWAGAVAGRSTAAFGRTSAPRGADGESFDKRLPAAAPAALIAPTSACFRAAAASSLSVAGLFDEKADAAGPAKDAAAFAPVRRPGCCSQPALRRPLRTAAALRHARCAYLRGFDPAWSDVVSVTSMDMEPGPRSAGAFSPLPTRSVVFRRALESLFGRLHVLSVPGACFPDVGLRSPVRRTGLEVRQRFRLFPELCIRKPTLNS